MRTDGLSGGWCTVTWLPHFLSHGFARESSAVTSLIELHKFWLSKELWGRGNSGDRSVERFPKPRKQILKQQQLSQNKKSSKRKNLSLSFFRVFIELRQKSSIKNYWVTLYWEVDVFFFSYVSRKDCDIIRKLAASVLLPRLTEMRTTAETPRRHHQQEVGFMRTARDKPTVDSCLSIKYSGDHVWRLTVNKQ